MINTFKITQDLSKYSVVDHDESHAVPGLRKFLRKITMGCASKVIKLWCTTYPKSSAETNNRVKL
jgi:hypothetical protein